MADDLECEICFNNYDETERRPYNLPCGHTFCGSCMNREIVNGKRTCATCRKPHRARCVKNLPINVSLERVIQNRGCSKKRALDSDDDDDDDGGRCPMHKKSILYFYCETHLMMVCRECTVLEHQVNQCKVIPIKEHIKRKKKATLCKIDSNVTDINASLLRLNMFIGENDKTIKSHQFKIKNMKKELQNLKDSVIFENHKNDAAQADILKGEAFKERNIVEKRNLENANSMSVIVKCVKDIDCLSQYIRGWRQQLNVDKD